MANITDTHPHYLFVYGTLRPGHGNNHVIQRCAGKDVGPARTSGEFLLNDGFPYVWAKPGRLPAYRPYLGRVVGHVYKVSDAGLEACDRLEGHPRHYCRTPIQVQLNGIAGQFVTAGIYLAPGGPPDIANLQKPRDGLLEWGRDEPDSRDFQRRVGRY